MVSYFHLHYGNDRTTEKIQVSQTQPGGQLAFVSDHFLASEFHWSVSPYCVLQAQKEGILFQGTAERRESKARWHAVAVIAKWLGVWALHDLSTQLWSGLQLAWVWLLGAALLSPRSLTC